MVGRMVHRRASAPAIFDVMPLGIQEVQSSKKELNAPFHIEVAAAQVAVRAASVALHEVVLDLPKAMQQLEHALEALRPLIHSHAECALKSEKFGPDFDTCESPDTARWLLDTFTDNLDVADDPFEMQVSKKSSLRVRFPARRGTVPQILTEPMTSEIMEKCGSTAFNALDLAAVLDNHYERPLPVFGAHVLRYRGDLINCIQERGWVKSRDTFTQTFMAFLRQLDCSYRPDVRYHNSAHAVDVMASLDVLMRTSYVTSKTTSLDHVMSLAAAAMHDVGHPGKNALFQTKTLSSLAIRYNDKSILENMHASLAFSIMQQDPGCNWLALLPDTGADQMPNLQQYVRQGMISMVLATDMAKHQKYVHKLRSLLETPSPATQSQDKVEDKFLLMDTLLHAADLSNPSKPRSIALAWTRRVCEEFWLQGDEERRLGLAVSPMCDREAGMVSVPQGQLGFINFVVRPLYNPLAELVPEVEQMQDQMAQNSQFWEERKEEGASFEQIFGEMPWIADI